MPERGRFIVLEGIDGSGTTTHAGLLQHYFVQQGRPVHCTQEPSGGPVGVLIRLALSHRVGHRTPDGAFAPLDETTLALAFAADRADHLQSEILPQLEVGALVVSDRYYLSTLAYQSLQIDLQWLRALNSRFPRPDLTIFLDVPPAICHQRMTADGRVAELYEDLRHLEQVRAAYLRAIDALRQEGERIAVVSGDRPTEEMHAEIVRLVEGS